MWKEPLEGCSCIFAQGPPSSKLRHCSEVLSYRQHHGSLQSCINALVCRENCEIPQQCVPYRCTSAVRVLH